MILRFLLFFGVLTVALSCGLSNPEDYSLDPAIPRVETPSERIASVRTKWFNDKQIGTAFLDNQDRLLESFSFGHSNAKVLNVYDGPNNILTVRYRHSDSAPLRYISFDSLRRGFDLEGRLIYEFNLGRDEHNGSQTLPSDYYHKRYLGYTAAGDTIVKKVDTSYEMPDTTQRVDIERWEVDENRRLKRHYKLYVLKSGPRTDTTNHFSRQFVYDSSGRLALARYDYMYLRDFYYPEGPDTIRYYYDAQNRLTKELHRYTTNMSNKGEPTERGLSKAQRITRLQARKSFLEGYSFRPSNRTDTIRYRYEAFDPKKHLPLKIPIIE